MTGQCHGPYHVKWSGHLLVHSGRVYDPCEVWWMLMSHMLYHVVVQCSAGPRHAGTFLPHDVTTTVSSTEWLSFFPLLPFYAVII